MADAYSTNEGLILMEEGTHSNEWGDLANLNFRRIDVMNRGYLAVDVDSGAVTLDDSVIDTVTSVPELDSFYRFLEFTGVSGTPFDVTAPAIDVIWFVYNNSGGDFDFIPLGGTGVTLTQGKFHMIVYGSNGTTFTDVTNVMFQNLDPVFDSVQLSGGLATEGTLSWNATEDTLDITQHDVVLQVGQESQIQARNQTAGIIADGVPVMSDGTTGATGRVLVTPMVGSVPANASLFIGITTEELSIAEDGKVTNFGKVRNIDTTGTPYGEVWANGETIYLDPVTTGALTNVLPVKPDMSVTVGFVIYAHAVNGVLFVKANNIDNNAGATTFESDAQDNIWAITGAGAALEATANDNFLVGLNAGNAITTGDDNIMIGRDAGKLMVIQSDNIWLGAIVGDNITNWDQTVAIGDGCISGATLQDNAGGESVYLGSDAGRRLEDFDPYNFNTGNWYNTFLGVDAGEDVVHAHGTVIIGQDAARNIKGLKDTNIVEKGIYIGQRSGAAASTATGAQLRNIHIGFEAGFHPTVPITFDNTDNIFLGSFAGPAGDPAAGSTGMLYINNASSDEPLIKGDMATGFLEVYGKQRDVFAVRSIAGQGVRVNLHKNGSGAASGYWGYSTSGATSQVISNLETNGNIDLSTNGTGVISVSHQLNLGSNGQPSLRFPNAGSPTVADGDMWWNGTTLLFQQTTARDLLNPPAPTYADGVPLELGTATAPFTLQYSGTAAQIVTTDSPLEIDVDVADGIGFLRANDSIGSMHTCLAWGEAAGAPEPRVSLYYNAGVTLRTSANGIDLNGTYMEGYAGVGAGQDGYLLSYNHSNTRMEVIDPSTLTGSGLFTEDGNDNIYGGTGAGASLTTGTDNILMGVGAGDDLNLSGFNIAIGNASLNGRDSTQNIAIGNSAVSSNTVATGGQNVSIGYLSLSNARGGSANVALGTEAGRGAGDNTAGSIFIGNFAGPPLGPYVNNSDELFINNAASLTPLIHGDFATGDITINGNLTVTGTSPGVGVFTLDGNNNIFAGSTAGDAITTATDCFLVGFNAGNDVTSGNNSIAIGNGSLGGGLNPDALTGDNNICIGAAAGAELDGLAADNIFIGFSAGLIANGNTFSNIFIGTSAGAGTLSKDSNVAIGVEALGLLDLGSESVAIGYQAQKGGGGANCVSIGYQAGLNMGSGSAQNTAVGSQAMKAVATYTTSTANTAIGYQAMLAATTGNANTAVGAHAMEQLTGTSTNNVAVGDSAGLGLTTAVSGNVAIGTTAMSSIATGVDNVVIGHGAGAGVTLTSSSNVFIGHAAGPSTGGVHNDELHISNVQTDTPLIGGNFASGTVTINGDLTVTGTGGFGDTNSLLLLERADHENTPAATFGEIWLVNTPQQRLHFTDDNALDYKLGMLLTANRTITVVGTGGNDYDTFNTLSGAVTYIKETYDGNYNGFTITLAEGSASSHGATTLVGGDLSGVTMTGTWDFSITSGQHALRFEDMILPSFSTCTIENSLPSGAMNATVTMQNCHTGPDPDIDLDIQFATGTTIVGATALNVIASQLFWGKNTDNIAVLANNSKYFLQGLEVGNSTFRLYSFACTSVTGTGVRCDENADVFIRDCAINEYRGTADMVLATDGARFHIDDMAITQNVYSNTTDHDIAQATEGATLFINDFTVSYSATAPTNLFFRGLTAATIKLGAFADIATSATETVVLTDGSIFQNGSSTIYTYGGTKNAVAAAGIYVGD